MKNEICKDKAFEVFYHSELGNYTTQLKDVNLFLENNKQLSNKG